jgi:predicted kinase
VSAREIAWTTTEEAEDKRERGQEAPTKDVDSALGLWETQPQQTRFIRRTPGVSTMNHSKMHTPDGSHVLILTGTPGSGKTTVARLLAGKSERAVHLESDQFFHFIQSGYIEPWMPESHEQNIAVMNIVASVAAGYAKAGYFTIIDGIISPRWFLEPVRDSLHAAGYTVAYAVLRAPLPVCLSRARDRAPGRLSDTAVIERLSREFVNLGRLETHVIDTGKQTADAAADLLSELLQTNRLVT